MSGSMDLPLISGLVFVMKKPWHHVPLKLLQSASAMWNVQQAQRRLQTLSSDSGTLLHGPKKKLTVSRSVTVSQPQHP